MKRCVWANENNPMYVDYHDQRWGKPVHEDQELFALLCLEGFQAGLSWECILKKEQAFREAFDGFDPAVVARYEQDKFDALMENPAIVRNRLKIRAATKNAQAFLALQQEYGSFDAYLWGHTCGHVLHEYGVTTSALSDQISAELKKKGMTFVGSTIIYSYLQAVGLVESHGKECDLRPTFTHPKLYLARVADFSSNLDVLLSTLDEPAKEKALRYRQSSDQVRSALASRLVREKVGEGTIVLGPQGKPSIPGQAPYNISHSFDWVGVCVHDEEVGFDVEQIARCDLSIAKAAFTPEERRFIKDQTSFAQSWTRKEAVAKCLGRGLEQPRSVGATKLGEGIYLYHDDVFYTKEWLNDGYSFTVASRKPIEEIEVFIVGPDELLR